jgi:hypothetical protein
MSLKIIKEAVRKKRATIICPKVVHTDYKSFHMNCLEYCGTKVSLGGDFMSLFPTHPDFRNSVEEFHPMKLSLLP